MPLIGTSGALAITKTALGGTSWWISWNAVGSDSYNIQTSVATITNSLTYFVGGRYFVSSGPTPVWLSAINSTYGTPVIPWQKRETGSSFFNTSDIVCDSSNNKIYSTFIESSSGSNSFAAYQQITNTNGNVDGIYIDSNAITGVNTPTFPYVRIPQSVAIDSTGNYYVAGTVNQKPNGSTNNYVLYYTKFNGATKISGNIINTGYTIGPATGTFTSQIVFNSTGQLIFGASVQSSGGFVFNLMSINVSTNTFNWQSTIAMPSINFTASYVQDNSDNYYMLFRGVVSGNTTAWIMKMNSSGVVQWSKQVTGFTSLIATGITTDGTNIYVNIIRTAIPSDFSYTLKIDANANILSERVIRATTGNLQTEFIVYDTTGLLYTGSSTSGPCVINLPSDSTIPGSGSYAVTANVTMSYSSSSALSLVNGSPGAGSLGTMTIGTATTTAYTLTTLTSNTSIATTTTKVLN